MSVKHSIVTFGCRVNQADSLRIEESLRARGASPASAPDTADLVVVNTCSVTAAADQGARQTVRRIARSNPAARIVVTCCYATRRPGELAALPGVIRVVANDQKDRLVDVLEDAELTTAERFGDGDGACGLALAPGAAGRTTFLLRVQTGCDERCSYCIIPSTRGNSRSLPLADVLAEVERAVAAGYKEIVLTGVHLGSYGRDLDPPTSLAALLRRLDRLPSRVLLRISSLEPMDCSEEIVDLVAAGGRFAPHFHLPLQHASDRMLAAMQRPYSLSCYSRLVERVRRCLPHASIGSDVIAGFPGETDRDADANLNYLRDSPLTYLHVFPYSDRPGTAAAAARPKVPGEVVRARARALREVGAVLSHRFRRTQVGGVRPGLTIEDGTAVLTDNYLKVRVPPGRRRNEWVDVRIDDAGEILAGTPIEQGAERC